VVRASLAIVLVVLLAAPPAQAATRTEILRDCQDGTLNGTYTPSELRDARNNIPADIDQYSDCRDVLTRALTSTAAAPDNSGGGSGGGGSATGGGGGAGGGTGSSGGGGGGGSGGSGGSDGTGGSGGAAATGTGGSAPTAPSAPVTPTGQEEQNALREAAAAPEPVTVGPHSVVPGASAFDPGSSHHSLPGSLVVTLLLLAAAALAAAAPVVRRRVVDRKPA